MPTALQTAFERPVLPLVLGPLRLILFVNEAWINKGPADSTQPEGTTSDDSMTSDGDSNSEKGSSTDESDLA